MGSSRNNVVVVMILLSCLFISPSTCTHPRIWYVGGENGWVPNPSEPYNEWAGRSRFVVDDKLVFKYEKEKDSVLEVTKEAYDACNVSSPIEKRTSGESIVSLEKQGLLYFISGIEGHCKEGQRLVVLVLSKKQRVPSPSSPTPKGQPPSSSPLQLGPSGYSPLEPSPSPEDIHSPVESPHSTGTRMFIARVLLGVVGLVMIALVN